MSTLVERIAEYERKVRLQEDFIAALRARVDWLERAFAAHLDIHSNVKEKAKS